jgi:hypothetical protein
LRVEGWIASENSGLLESECLSRLKGGRRIRLDCSLVTYVDSRGAAVLRRLQGRRVEIFRCPAIIRDYVEASEPSPRRKRATSFEL